MQKYFDFDLNQMEELNRQAQERVQNEEIKQKLEELGITDFIPEQVSQYVYDSVRERELVFVHKTIYDQEIIPSAETDGGRFWTMEEVKENMGKSIFTPNFESEIKKLNWI